jgi:hypothetical protein
LGLRLYRLGDNAGSGTGDGGSAGFGGTIYQAKKIGNGQMRVIMETLLFGAVFALSSEAWGYVYDPNDFAVEVVAYVEGTGIPKDNLTGQLFNNPLQALGRPTVDTLGDGKAAPYGQSVPVLPVYPSWRSTEAVSIGHRGHLTLKFSHPVGDELHNPYGIDFIVFGNSFQKINGSDYWLNSNPSTIFTLLDMTREPGIVSVSQDGSRWYSFGADPNYCQEVDFDDPNFPGNEDFWSGLYADDFVPTLGRVYDASLPGWWGEPTDPTQPMNPAVTKDDFKLQTVAAIGLLYGTSAGGTGFDISRFPLPPDPQTGRKWIQYVRINNPREGGATPEIDAVSDVAACGDWKHPFPPGDVTMDCRVDLADIAVISENWLVCTWECEE